MQAVKLQVTQNVQQAQSFFNVLTTGVENFFNEEIGVNKKNSIQDACHSVLLLSPLFKIYKQHVVVRGLDDR